MRGSRWIAGACLALTLCGTDAGAEPAAGKGDENTWGVVARGGYFGVPDVVADKLFVQHPKVAGSTYGGEIRYHGDGGGRGVASIGLAVDAGTTEGNGIWQTDEFDPPTAAGGDIKMLAFTLTGYWTAFPSWYVHPYVGIGIGAGYFKGTLTKDDDLTEVSLWLPVVHIPLGIAVELGERLQLAVETRFIDGITAGGALQVRF